MIHYRLVHIVKQIYLTECCHMLQLHEISLLKLLTLERKLRVPIPHSILVLTKTLEHQKKGIR